jgi:hypothetical protein
MAPWSTPPGAWPQPLALLPAPTWPACRRCTSGHWCGWCCRRCPVRAGWRVQVARDERFDACWPTCVRPRPSCASPAWPMAATRCACARSAATGSKAVTPWRTLWLKARPEPPLPRAPAARATLRGSAADFAWTASSEAARYRLQLARDDGSAAPFSAPLLDLKDLAALAHRADGLPPGVYVWRVGSVRADGDAGPFGDPMHFELRALPPQPAPPEPPAVGDRSIRFFWQGVPGQRFELQVARDADFQTRVAEPLLDGTTSNCRCRARAAFVRLRARDADGFVGPWSATQFFDVPNCVRDAQAGCVRTEGGPLQPP